MTAKYLMKRLPEARLNFVLAAVDTPPGEA